MGDSGALLLGFTLGAVVGPGPARRPPPWRRSSCRCSCSPCRCSTRRSSSRSGSSTASRSTSPTARTCTTASRTSASRSGAPSSTSTRWCVTLALAALATRFVHPHRRTATGTRRTSRSTPSIGLARDRRLDLRRLPARDRQARESVHPAQRKRPSSRERSRAKNRITGRFALSRSPDRAEPAPLCCRAMEPSAAPRVPACGGGRAPHHDHPARYRHRRR